MSRRKQSNPKPLKVEEESGCWNAAEDGGKESKNGPDERPDSSEQNLNLEPGEKSSQQTHSYKEEEDVEMRFSPRTHHTSGGSNHSKSSIGKGIRIRSNRDILASTDCQSPNEEPEEDEQDADEYAVDAEDDLRPSSSSPQPTSSRHHQQGSAHNLRRSSRHAKRQRIRHHQMSPEDVVQVVMDTNENSQESSSSFSQQQQQMLQVAGLPYLHLLPPAMRNDAARLFFMPPEQQVMAAGNNNGGSSSSRSSGRNSCKTPSKNEKNENPPTVTQRTGPAYICEPCNIKFSSANTLEAHQTFYCSFRKDPEKDGRDETSLAVPEFDGISPKGERITPSGVSPSPAARSSAKRNNLSDDRPESCGSDDGEEHELSIDESQDPLNQQQQLLISNGIKNIKTGKLYSCIYCSYSADKKVSLNRHMRMHSGGGPNPNLNTNTNSNSNDESGRSCSTPFNTASKQPQQLVEVASTSNSNAPPPNSTALERYCLNCDIQFSSIKTFRVHKQYYCSTRHVLKGQAVAGSTSGPIQGTSSSSPLPSTSAALHHQRSSSSRNSPSTSNSPPPGQPFVLLPTNPVIIVPYCFIQGATVLPGNILPNQNALVVHPNGIVQGLPNTLVLPLPPSSSHHHPFNSPSSSIIPAANSPTNHANVHQFVFNDPKDVIKRMSSNSKSRNNPSVESSDSQPTAPNQLVGCKDRESSPSPNSRGESGRGRARNAIDLTLRATASGDEKESHSGSNRSSGGSSTGSRSSHHHHLDQDPNDHLEIMHHEHHSPSLERLNSGNGGGMLDIKRTTSIPSSRPSSASISSNCSTSPPAQLLGEQHHKLNGLKMERLSPSSFQQLDNQQQREFLLYHQQQQQKLNHTSSPSRAHKSSSKRGDGPAVDFEYNNNRSSKMNPIATQFPGGAILTSASNQSLAELLMSNPPELNESLAKLNSQLLMNSSTTAMMAAAAASLPPELAIRFLSDPTYLSSLQQHISQQQLNINAQSVSKIPAASPINMNVPVGPPAKRGVSKCIECDIVFYKYENYLVHKEHYCAATARAKAMVSPSESTPTGPKMITVNGDCSKLEREPLSPQNALPPPATRQRRSTATARFQQTRKTPPDEMMMMNSGEPSDKQLLTISLSKSKSPHQANESSNSPPPVGVTITPTSLAQYSCIQCGVKFTSIDNLKTHQAFYCSAKPSPELIEDEQVMLNVPVVGGNKKNASIIIVDEKNGILKCNTCKLVIPEDQMNIHGSMCLGNGNGIGNSNAIGSTNGWKCPCCDTYSPTMSSAQKHLETHSGVRAFKCVLCGYRGNTIRGMRTHIRMHFDKRVSTELHEADYITCITSKDLEASLPQSHSQHSNVGNNVVLTTAAATAAVHGALRISTSPTPNQNHSQSSSPSPLGSQKLSSSPTTQAQQIKNNNNNNSTDVIITTSGGEVNRGHHPTKAMLYVT